MRKNFPLRVTEPWPRLPREAVESLSLEIFKTPLVKVVCSLLWVTHRGPFHPPPFCDSVRTLEAKVSVCGAATVSATNS